MNMPDNGKSSRHPKIAGDFGEALVLYWLSKNGFECARVDHTGIDLIAHHPRKSEVLGISVKSRTRTQKTIQDYLTIKSGEFKKIEDACRAFGCVPYFAFVIDAGGIIRVFITTMKRFLEMFPRTASGASGWKMSPAYLEQYSKDSEIMTFELNAKINRWWT